MDSLTNEEQAVWLKENARQEREAAFEPWEFAKIVADYAGLRLPGAPTQPWADVSEEATVEGLIAYTLHQKGLEITLERITLILICLRGQLHFEEIPCEKADEDASGNCPKCGSRNVCSHTDANLRKEHKLVWQCFDCDWFGERTGE